MVEDQSVLPAETEPKKPNFEARAPDFIGNDHNAVAWIAAVNTNGEIITLNLKIGELRLKLKKRFL
jgi:hypothetical protein